MPGAPQCTRTHLVEPPAVRQVPPNAEAHDADLARAQRVLHQPLDARSRVAVVRINGLCDLELVATVSTWGKFRV